ncbi:MAG TPA: hypothetical protein ENN46_02535 [Candidatus Woesearchaeota archaeon]|nr:hypothetical protein [Candidatus Woesearchaeota archaeon]
MNEHYLRRLLGSRQELERKIEEFKNAGVVKIMPPDINAVKGHIAKAVSNIRFVDSISKEFSDWAVVGCYYCLYHAALALIIRKGFFSKSHDATLCLLMLEYYRDLSEDDLALVNFAFLTKEDILFYVKAKNKREEASYSAKTRFGWSDINTIFTNTRLFLNKAKKLISE